MTIQNKSKALAVFEALREDIVNGVIGANERLVERDLVERFGVSKTPVREALSMLRHEGLVRGRYYRGMKVVRLSAETLRELYELREVLEGLAARCAATNKNQELSRQLLANAAAQEDALQSDRFYDLNAEFHGLVLEQAANSELSRTLNRLYDRYRVTSNSKLNPLLNQPRTRNWDIIREHKAIASSIDHGAPAAAEELARQHVRNAFSRLAYDPDRQDSSSFVAEAST